MKKNAYFFLCNHKGSQQSDKCLPLRHCHLPPHQSHQMMARLLDVHHHLKQWSGTCGSDKNYVARQLSPFTSITVKKI